MRVVVLWDSSVSQQGRCTGRIRRSCGTDCANRTLGELARLCGWVTSAHEAAEAESGNL